MATLKVKKEGFSQEADSMKMNRIRPTTNVGFNALFVVLSLMCIIPVIFVFIISISSEDSLRLMGYSFFPMELSGKAYEFLWNERGTIFQAFKISVIVTVLGTILGLILTTSMGYVLSRPQYRLKRFYTWMVFIP